MSREGIDSSNGAPQEPIIEYIFNSVPGGSVACTNYQPSSMNSVPMSPSVAPNNPTLNGIKIEPVSPGNSLNSDRPVITQRSLSVASTVSCSTTSAYTEYTLSSSPHAQPHHSDVSNVSNVGASSVGGGARSDVRGVPSVPGVAPNVFAALGVNVPNVRGNVRDVAPNVLSARVFVDAPNVSSVRGIVDVPNIHVDVRGNHGMYGAPNIHGNIRSNHGDPVGFNIPPDLMRGPSVDPLSTSPFNVPEYWHRERLFAPFENAMPNHVSPIYPTYSLIYSILLIPLFSTGYQSLFS